MNIRSLAIACFVVPGLLFAGANIAEAKEDLEPGDPFAAVDGDPIYIGEINLVLTQRIAATDLTRVGEDVRRATALVLVRRHLAMKAMSKLGGETLRDSIDRRLQAYAGEAKRRGTSVAELAAARQATEDAMLADIAWTTAWTQYLKSKMTPENLRRYFESHSDRYSAATFDGLTDQADLRRDAANALFESLVASQSETKVKWFIESLYQQERQR
ncbi:hypothetical protein Poly51_50020 [Rubripirellula tenax]|uniref:Peptidylprolyl isomerase n=1 Tax=Rubripirellula tenax TaxID=2528015 RepID=A0A5C6EFG9_9BACT|nr:hypothetical protein [Rubripirellula tenax]TWU47204.1 hypothetical protein Poly51_50020 [Rubripirellula tenax]